MPLFGSEKVAEPVPFVGIRLGKEMYQGKAKVVAQGGRQVPATIVVEETVVVEGQVGCVVPRPNMPVFDIVAVVPLVPRQVVELQEEAPGPPFAGLPVVARIIMALLQLPPFGREEPLEHVLPTNGRLGLSCSSYRRVIKQHKGELGLTPAGEICQDGLSESRKSVRISKALGKLGQVSIPHLIGAHRWPCK